MPTKIEILARIHDELNAGTITPDDLWTLAGPPPPPQASQPALSAAAPAPAAPPPARSGGLSAADVMFYVAGFVLYAAVMSSIAQSWNEGSALVHILLSAGLGLGLWMTAYYLIKSAVQSDIRKGLINALLLTGSLLVVTGGYIITNEIIGGFDEVNFIPGAIMLAVVGGLHIAFDRLVKRDLLLLLGIILMVAAFPAFMFGLLQNSDASIDVWSGILVATALLLAYATRVVARLVPDRPDIRRAFDPLAAFLALGSMYAATFGSYAGLWLVALIASVLGLFYLSVLSQSKQLLGNASVFLIITVITIAFKYFSGFGITTSLVLAAIGLLGSAAVASGINKKYFKPANALK